MNTTLIFLILTLHVLKSPLRDSCKINLLAISEPTRIKKTTAHTCTGSRIDRSCQLIPTLMLSPVCNTNSKREPHHPQNGSISRRPKPTALPKALILVLRRLIADRRREMERKRGQRQTATELYKKA